MIHMFSSLWWWFKHFQRGFFLSYDDNKRYMDSNKYPWRENSKVTITQIILNILNAYKSASYTVTA